MNDAQVRSLNPDSITFNRSDPKDPAHGSGTRENWEAMGGSGNFQQIPHSFFLIPSRSVFDP